MLPREKKVNRKEFPTQKKKGVVYHSPYFLLVVVKNNKETPTKFSFVVSVKISKKATERNKLKRRGYNIIKKIYNDIQSGFVCVFFLKKNIATLSYPQFEEHLRALLEKARILKNT